MKTALEALTETVDNERRQARLIEDEKRKCRATSAETVKLWCNGIIQEEINNAIKNSETKIDIFLLDSYVSFRPCGTRYQCWRMIPSSRWDWGTYNSKANGYFDIPKREGYVVNPSEIVDFISSFGYEVQMTDISIRVADTRTGMCANNEKARKITISWGHIQVKNLV